MKSPNKTKKKMLKIFRLTKMKKRFVPIKNFNSPSFISSANSNSRRFGPRTNRSAIKNGGINKKALVKNLAEKPTLQGGV